MIYLSNNPPPTYKTVAYALQRKGGFHGRHITAISDQLSHRKIPIPDFLSLSPLHQKRFFNHSKWSTYSPCLYRKFLSFDNLLAYPSSTTLTPTFNSGERAPATTPVKRISPGKEMPEIIRKTDQGFSHSTQEVRSVSLDLKEFTIPYYIPSSNLWSRFSRCVQCSRQSSEVDYLHRTSGIPDDQLEKKLQDINKRYFDNYFDGALSLELCNRYENQIFQVLKSEINTPILFRQDTRPLEEIFPSGFVAKDESQTVTLKSYLFGNTKNSQYISTTTRPMLLISNYIGQAQKLYIYVLERRDLRSIYMPTCLEVPLRNRMQYLYQSEHTFTDRIPPESIPGAYLVERGKVISWSSNPYYERAPRKRSPSLLSG